MSTTQESFFQKVWNAIISVFHTEQSISQDIAKFADEATNWLKNGKYTALIEGGIQTIATAINPALGSMVSGLELELPKLLGAISNVASETTAQQAQTLDAYLTNLKGISGTGYANALNGINAVIQEYATNNSGEVTATPAQLIASAVSVHAGSVA